MIYTVVQSKGGVGKSLLSDNVIPLLIDESNFEVIEIDSTNNTAETYHSSTLLKDRIRTIRINEADDTLDDVFYEAMANKKDVILDCGGGTDTINLLSLLAEQPQDNIKYIIPMTLGNDDSNALATYKMLPEGSDVLFVLNGYTYRDDLKRQFVFWFGDPDLDIKGLKSKIKGARAITIPFSNLFKVAQLNYGMSISDLAAQSRDLPPEKASEIFLKESAGDKDTYKRLYRRYKISLRARKTLDEIFENLKQIG